MTQTSPFNADSSQALRASTAQNDTEGRSGWGLHLTFANSKGRGRDKGRKNLYVFFKEKSQQDSHGLDINGTLCC